MGTAGDHGQKPQQIEFYPQNLGEVIGTWRDPVSEPMINMNSLSNN